MIVVDTCGWIEALADTPIGREYQPLIGHTDELIVPTLIQFEFYKWLSRTLGEPAANEIIATTQASRVVPLTSEIALFAADLSREHSLATADAIIYATARTHNAELVTSDAHFRDLPGVRLVAKKSR
jgi:predicted nucleic acid-binding protein